MNSQARNRKLHPLAKFFIELLSVRAEFYIVSNKKEVQDRD